MAKRGRRGTRGGKKKSSREKPRREVSLPGTVNFGRVKRIEFNDFDDSDVERMSDSTLYGEDLSFADQLSWSKLQINTVKYYF